MREGPIRVLVAKPGVDGHDVGAKLVCRALMEAGMEVTYTGLRQSPEAIATAALQESADVVALSILSGAHLPLTQRVLECLRARGVDDVLLVVGGCIPPGDVEARGRMGVHAVFPTGTPLATGVDFIRARVSR